MNESSLNKRYFLKLLASAFSGIISILIVAIVPKAIGADQFGQFTYLQQFFMKIINFFDASSSTAFFTKLSANPNRKELIGIYGVFSILILILILLIFYIIDRIGINHLIVPRIESNYILYGILFSFLTWIVQIFIKISDAYAMTVSIEILKILHKLSSFVILIGLIWFFTLNLKIYLLFQIATLLLFIVITFYFFYKKNIFDSRVYLISLDEVRRILLEFIEYCSPLFVYSIIALGAGIFDIWLLQKVSGSEETGFYGLSYSIAAICFIFTGAMTPVLMREFSKLYERNKVSEMAVLFNRYVPMLYAIAVYFSVFIAFQSGNVINIFTNDEFEAAQLSLIVMAFFPIHQTYGQLTGSIFYSTGNTKFLRNVGLMSSLISVILVLLFVYQFELGALGLAWKIVLTQIITVNVQLFYSTKLLGLSYFSFLKHQISTLILFGLVGYLSTYATYSSSPLYDFFISGIIYTIFTILVLFIYPNLFSLQRRQLYILIKTLINKCSQI